MRITPERKQQQEENAKRLIDAIKKLACNESVTLEEINIIE